MISNPRDGDDNDVMRAFERNDIVAYTVTDRPNWLEPGFTMTPDETVVV